MAYIHGGSYIIGSSSYNDFNPELFLEEGVIFVSFNYRLGPVGKYIYIFFLILKNMKFHLI